MVRAMTDTSIDRTSPEYRARIRELAETKRQPPPDRKHQRRDRPAPERRPYPWIVDAEIDPD